MTNSDHWVIFNCQHKLLEGRGYDRALQFSVLTSTIYGMLDAVCPELSRGYVLFKAGETRLMLTGSRGGNRIADFFWACWKL